MNRFAANSPTIIWVISAIFPLIFCIAANAYSGSDGKIFMDMLHQQMERIEKLHNRLDAIEKKTEQKIPAPSAESHKNLILSKDKQAAQISHVEKSPAVEVDRMSSETRDIGAPNLRATSKDSLGKKNAPLEQDLIVKWGSGGMPTFSTRDGRYFAHIRGRLTTDYGSGFGSRFTGRNVTRTSLSAARLGVEGNIDKFSYIFEAEFANQTRIKDAWVGYPVNFLGHLMTVSLGNKLNERGFESSGSALNKKFVTYSMVSEAIQPLRGQYGLGVVNKLYGKNWHISTEITGDDVSQTGPYQRDDVVFLQRGVYLPYRGKDSLLHLGVWGFYENAKPTNDPYSPIIGISGLTNTAFNPVLGYMPPLASSRAVGGELFGYYRQIWILGEYGVRGLKFRRSTAISSTDNGQDNWGKSGQVQAFSLSSGVILTGGKVSYTTEKGTWGRTTVSNPVTKGGWGEIELLGRWDVLDATHVPNGGTAWTATAGLNWYPIDNVRFVLDYEYIHTNNKALSNRDNYMGQDGGNLVVFRSQISW